MTFQPTIEQAQFLKIADWFLGSYPRRAGRSTVVGMVALQQAIAGHRVYLMDASVALTYGNLHRIHQNFAYQVLGLGREFYPDYSFRFHEQSGILACDGLSYMQIPEGL